MSKNLNVSIDKIREMGKVENFRLEYKFVALFYNIKEFDYLSKIVNCINILS